MRNSKGVVQGIALLGLSVVGAFLLQSQSTAVTAASASGTGSATSDSYESGFGPVQLKVTEEAGKIIAIDLVQAQATGGREQAFSYLVQEALSANGATFANISGATYTTEAFKSALNDAMAKIG
ncbi:MAG: hypothetical protein RL319_772 [Actinomycetota bacterium]